MGAGKTTVGAQCATRLDRPFVDTDELVEATAGATVAEIFERYGEPRFRELERRAVADACGSPAPVVIACGGGAVLDPDNRRQLARAGFVVWLRAASAVLSERVGATTSRPLLGPEGRGRAVTLERLATVRAGAYEAIADAVVDTDHLASVDGVAAAVLAVYAGRGTGERADG